MNIRALIVDDEMPAREELKYLIEKYEGIEIVDEAKHGLEALNILKEKDIDLVFLDISMPKISGIDVAETISSDKNKMPFIIFITAYDDYAIKAFELNAIDYLLKPVTEDRLIKAINRVEESLYKDNYKYEMKLKNLINDMNSNYSDYKSEKVCLYKDGTFIPVDKEDIILATIEDKNIIIITNKGKFVYHETLTHLEERLSNDNFFRSHRSYLINLDYINKIEPWFNNTYHIDMEGYEKKVPVSRGQVKDFRVIMNII